MRAPRRLPAARLRRLAHLAGRFVGSLRPRPLDELDRAWVRAQLTAAEHELFARLGPADRAEALATARRTVATLRATGAAGDTRWTAAALCHDVGKAAAALGPVGRALATAAGALVGRRRVRGRWRAYLDHAAVGAGLLAAAGARPETVAWAAAHHDPPRWPLELIPPEVCAALAAADGERW